MKLLFDTILTLENLNGLSMNSLHSQFPNEAASCCLGVTLIRYVEAMELILHSFSLLRNNTESDLQSMETNGRILSACALKKACQLLVSLISRSPPISTKQCKL